MWQKENWVATALLPGLEELYTVLEFPALRPAAGAA